MAAVGGSIRDVTLGGRNFTATNDAEVQRKLGGDENEFQPNGDGVTGRLIKTIVGWSLDGLVIEIDDSRDDQTFLQDLIDGNDFFAVAVTYASGETYSGVGQIVGENPVSNQTSAGAVSLMGPGKLTRQ